MISDQIIGIIAQTVKDTFQSDVRPTISYPDAQFGDFATNVAFLLAKELKRPPKQIAEELASAITGQQVDEAVAVNGFINLSMSQDFWVQQLHQIKDDYGSSDFGQGKTVQVEFISANPTGPLTIGNGRGGYGGDVLARVLSRAGYKVEREYYVNDAGNQIAILNRSILAAVQEQLGIELVKVEDAVKGEYKGAYIQDLASKIVTQIQQDNPDLGQLDQATARTIIMDAVEQQHSLNTIIGWIKDVVERMGVEFTAWFSEQKELHDSGKVTAIVNGLQRAGRAEERDEAIWLKDEGEGSNDRVLKKSDGSYTYLAADLAYHKNKLQERGFNLAINLWGADHHSQVASIQNGIKLLELPGRLDVILFQLVRLIKDGVEYKVSKRAGTYVTMDEILDEVPSDVLRFFFLMRSFNTPMDLDLDLALEQSQKNPLYYVMYSYARANSILEQASGRGLSPLSTGIKLSGQELAVVRYMTRLPQLIQEIATSYEVHRLTFFGIELAKLFHDLYESERIIDLNKAEASKRLYVIQQYALFMVSYFNLLGITPQRRMEPKPVE
jgi:arginyl-tRNA synthetase